MLRLIATIILALGIQGKLLASDDHHGETPHSDHAKPVQEHHDAAHANHDGHAATADAAHAPSGETARLEIRQYRFSRFNGTTDRLVLEFDQKGGTAPKVRTEASTEFSGAVVAIEPATLLGAIPESLINDSYHSKSRFLGPISLNLDTESSGFSIRTAVKKPGTRVQAQWLQGPARLVIDAQGPEHHVSAPATRQTMSIERHSKYPSLDHLMCFPATARVGLTVVFQPRSSQAEELQNIRVNTDGSAPVEAEPAKDTIVCYPKQSQISARLSFEAVPENPLAHQTQRDRFFNGPSSAHPNEEVALDPHAQRQPSADAHGKPALLPKH